jgi:hypothetical protein
VLSGGVVAIVELGWSLSYLLGITGIRHDLFSAGAVSQRLSALRRSSGYFPDPERHMLRTAAA